MTAAETPRLVLLHLQKTGGTSLHALLARGFPPAAICPVRYNELDRVPPAELARYRYFSGHYDHDALAAIPGPKRVVTILREPRARLASLYLFWSRHSAEWVSRHPDHPPALARQCADFTAFLAHPALLPATDNDIARRLAGDCTLAGPGQYLWRGRPIAPEALLALAEANLRRIDFVGVMEGLAALYARVAAAQGLPPVAAMPRLNTRDDITRELEPAPPLAITTEAEALLRPLTWMDQRLYRLARELAA